jgi:hypothetical protein
MRERHGPGRVARYRRWGSGIVTYQRQTPFRHGETFSCGC